MSSSASRVEDPAAGTGPRPEGGGALAARLRQAWAAARFDLLRIRRGRYARARAALIFLPVLVSAIGAFVLFKLAEQPFSGTLMLERGSQTPEQTLSLATKALWPLSLRFVMFLAILELFGNLFRSEIADRTLHHVFLQPLRREMITIGKYVAGVLTLVRLGAVAWLLVFLFWLVPHGPGALFGTLLSGPGLRFLFSYLLAMSLAVIAYGGLFLLAGEIARGPVMIGFSLWIWEALAIFLPASFQRFTIAFYVNSLLPLRVPPKWALAQEADPASLPVAILVPLVFGAACVTLAALRARRLQLAYGAAD